MQEKEIRNLIEQVRDGQLSRRSFVKRMLAVGLTVPMAGMMLSYNGVAIAGEKFHYKPTKAGGGGTLKLVEYQATTLLNPHFANGGKDQDGSAIFYEPLANWDEDGSLTPVLAAEIPSIENGGVAADGSWVVWKLKQGVKWHDGAPFNADDCLFNAAYASDPQTAAYTLTTYKDIKVEKIDDYTIKVVYPGPTPFWADAFVGVRGLIIPKHIFEKYTGAAAREAPENLMPVGTGAYKITKFVPGDLILADRNPDYHVPHQPYFDALEIKGGGDAASAGRAVLQTAEYDFAYNLTLEEELLKKLESDGKGHIELVGGAYMEMIQFNFSDPNKEVDGERSSMKTEHPAFKDKAARDAINLLLDRQSIDEFVYGRAGTATANFINFPERFRSPNTSWEYNIEKAGAILDKAGWAKGSDGIRAKDGVRMSFVFQTSTNTQRQSIQAILKQSCQQVGIELELKAVSGSVFFASDPGNPDTFAHFYADLQMYTYPMREPDPAFYMQQFLGDNIAQKENGWQKHNVIRWKNKEYDDTYEMTKTVADPVKRAELFIKLNDIVINDRAVVPVAYRQLNLGIKNGLVVRMSSWSSHLAYLSDWYRDA